MPTDPSRRPEIGQRIRYTTKTARRGYLETETREGVVMCLWTNGWDGGHISVDDGGHCFPANSRLALAA